MMSVSSSTCMGPSGQHCQQACWQLTQHLWDSGPPPIPSPAWPACLVPAGTSERVLLLSGSLHSVLTSVFLMLEKLPKEPIMAMGRAAAKPREDVVSGLHAPAWKAAARCLACGAAPAGTGAAVGAMVCAQSTRCLAGKSSTGRVVGQQSMAGREAGTHSQPPAMCRARSCHLALTVCVRACVCVSCAPPVQVKMAVSRKLCGAVIGQKGQTIRDFMLDSGAIIRVQVGDSVVRVSAQQGGRGGSTAQHSTTTTQLQHITSACLVAAAWLREHQQRCGLLLWKGAVAAALYGAPCRGSQPLMPHAVRSSPPPASSCSLCLSSPPATVSA